MEKNNKEMIMTKRYILQHSQAKENGLVLTDTKKGIVIEFEKGKFNETQKVTMLNDIDSPDVMEMARVMREMGEWLIMHHKDIAEK